MFMFFLTSTIFMIPTISHVVCIKAYDCKAKNKAHDYDKYCRHTYINIHVKMLHSEKDSLGNSWGCLTQIQSSIFCDGLEGRHAGHSENRVGLCKR